MTRVLADVEKTPLGGTIRATADGTQMLLALSRPVSQGADAAAAVVSEHLLELAAKHGVEYDGWEIELSDEPTEGY